MNVLFESRDSAQAVLDEAKHHLARIELRRVRWQVDDGDRMLLEPCIELDRP